jgi:hypothetical protein
VSASAPLAHVPRLRHRPTAVTAAARVLLVAAGLALLYAVIVFTQVGTIASAETASEETLAQHTGSDIFEISGSFALLGVGGVIFAGLFARCTVTLLRGQYGSRGTSWGIGALAVMCMLCNVLITGFDLSPHTFDPATDNNLSDALPQWYRISALAIQSAVIVLMVAMTVLLSRLSAAVFLSRPGLDATSYYSASELREVGRTPAPAARESTDGGNRDAPAR